MIKRETAANTWNAYREIETAEELLKELEEKKEEAGRDFDKNAPTLRDAFGRVGHLQLGIPSGGSGHQLYNVSPPLAESVIRAHIENKKAELAEANEQARIELQN